MKSQMKDRMKTLRKSIKRNKTSPVVLALFEMLKEKQYESLSDVVPITDFSNANLSVLNEEGQSLLHKAVTHNRKELVPIFVNVGVKIDVENSEGKTALLLAWKQAIELQKKWDMDPTLIDDKTTPWDMVTTLVNNGANPNAPDKNGLTLLHKAIQSANIHAVSLLFSYGNLKIKEKRKADGYTELHIASSNNISNNRNIGIPSENRPEILRMILNKLKENGKDLTYNHLNAKNDNEETPLHVLMRSRKANLHISKFLKDFDSADDVTLECAQILLVEGADPYAQNSTGLTPFDLIQENDEAMQGIFKPYEGRSINKEPEVHFAPDVDTREKSFSFAGGYATISKAFAKNWLKVKKEAEMVQAAVQEKLEVLVKKDENNLPSQEIIADLLSEEEGKFSLAQIFGHEVVYDTEDDEKTIDDNDNTPTAPPMPNAPPPPPLPPKETPVPVKQNIEDAPEAPPLPQKQIPTPKKTSHRRINCNY